MGLDEVMGWGSQDGISGLEKERPELAACSILPSDTEPPPDAVQMLSYAFGLLNLQHGKKTISVLRKLPSLRCCVIAAENGPQQP